MDYSPIIKAAIGPLLWVLAAIIVLALLQVLLQRLRPRLLGLLGERTVARMLKRYAARVANDIILPNGLGGLTQIDHLALTPNGILVIETKNYSGLLYGQAQEKNWTQVIGRRRHPFHNPLRQNHGHIKAVEALVTDLAVEGRVAFVGRAKFPKGRPAGVLDLAGLERELASIPKTEIPLSLLMAWEDLIAKSRQDQRSRREHLSGLRARLTANNYPRPNAAQSVGFRWTKALLPLGLFILVPVVLIGLIQDLQTTSQQIRSPGATEQSSVFLSSTPLAVIPRTIQQAVAGPSPASKSQPEISEPEPLLRWSNPTEHSNGIRRCREAQAAVLIENSASNRHRRDSACADRSGDAGGQDQKATGSAIVAEPWKQLHSAGELTPNF